MWAINERIYREDNEIANYFDSVYMYCVKKMLYFLNSHSSHLLNNRVDFLT